jgi:hypothetical protein
MPCAICKIRREKRHCPGVHGDICAICCGEERERTVNCPFDCEYLELAHRHEALEKKDPAGVPSPDIRITNEFLQKNVQVVMTLQHALLQSALEANAIDNDAKEALDGLVRTYKTLESGLYYESRPTNPMAAAIFDGIQRRVNEIRERETERGVHKVVDGQIFKILVLLQHMEYAFNNGRPRGRCFLHNLQITLGNMAAHQAPPEATSLLVS